MAKIQPKTGDVWTVGFNPWQEAFMLAVMAAFLGALGGLLWVWLQNRPPPYPWAWLLGGLAGLGFTLEWVFFEDFWVIDRRTRTAYRCRPFRRTEPFALAEGTAIEVKDLGRGRLDVHFAFAEGRRLWVTRDRREVLAPAVQEFAKFIGLPVREAG